MWPALAVSTVSARLPCLGKCHRVLGVDYADFEELGEVMPEPTQYDDVCGQCWRVSRAVAPDSTRTSSASGSVMAVASRDDDAAGSVSECSVDDSSSTEA